MKLKKKVKVTLIIILIALIAVAGFFVYKKLIAKEEVKEVKIVNEIKEYGYKLKENKPK